MKKKKPLDTDEKTINALQKKMMVTWRPAGMAPINSEKTAAPTRKKKKTQFDTCDGDISLKTIKRQGEDISTVRTTLKTHRHEVGNVWRPAGDVAVKR